MATNSDFMQYIADQMSGAGDITYRKMFGEYGLYYRNQLFALVCDNALFFKPTETDRHRLGTPILRPPYEGAKGYFHVEDVDNASLLVELVKVTCKELTASKRDR